MTSAIVVGAGIGGLTVARQLAQAGITPLVLDGRDAPGGAVRSHTVGGLTMDAGAESFATRGDHVAKLLTDMGLGDRITGPNPVGAWVQLPDSARPMPRGGVLGIPGKPWSPQIREALGVLGAARASVDLIAPAWLGANAPSLRAQISRRMGRRVVERLVHPVVGGVYGADPSDVTLKGLAPHLANELPASRGSLARAVRRVDSGQPAGAVQGLEGGLFTLTDTLVDEVTKHGGTVTARERVTRVAREGDSWLVETTQGSHHADLVVLAAPALDVLAETADLTLDPERPTTVVTLVLVDHRLDRGPRGTGVLVAPGCVDVRAKAMTHSTIKWTWLADVAGPGTQVLRVSYDGDLLGKRTPENLATMRSMALVDAGRLFGLALTAARLVDFDVVVWTQGMPRPSATHKAAVERVREVVEATPGLAVTGAWVAGTGLAAVVSDARKTASRLVERFS